MLKRSILAMFCLSLLGSAAVSAADPTLIGWWKLNEGTGAVALDSSGNGNHGTVVRPNAGLGPGGSVWMNDPERGTVISFDGTASGAYVRAGKIPQMTLTNDFTWVFWGKQDPGNGANEIVFGNRMNENAADFVPRQFIKFTPTQLEWHQNSVGTDNLDYTDIPNGVWLHHVLVKTGNRMTYYRNGVAAGSRTITQALDFPMPLFFGGDNENNAAGEMWAGRMSDARVYTRALTESEIRDVMAGKGPTLGLAGKPSPADQATDVPRDATLSWTPGEFAATHDVYFGPTFADVNTAGRTDKKGVLASQGQTDAAFDPPGVFAYGQTYYWRVDEVNKAPDNAIFKGDVWSFTAEPYGYPVKPVKATASSNQASMGPENTINGSGLTGDLHGTEPTTMWLSAGAQPNWIQYEFDKVYKLHQLQVWNSNQLIEAFLGFGAKKATVETSTDGTTWKALANVPEFAKASGMPGYAANTTVNFGGVEAKFVKLTINTNQGGMAPQTGLAEVRFSYVPVQARAPQPATAAKGVAVDTPLDWRPGREAASHQVFFGTDKDAVTNGTAPAKTVEAHGFTPAALNFGTTYYWRVDEVNAVTYPGDVWSFTTQEFAVVDDFEKYTDKAGEEIFTAWVDGFATGQNGSTVGNNTAVNGTFGETSIVHGGKQSMPMDFDNSKSPFYSEAVQTFTAQQDWTGNGATHLSLWVRGQAAAFVDKGNGAFTVGASGHDIWDAADDFRFVYKKLSGDGSIVVKVDSLVGSTNAWSKAGVMIRQSLEANSAMVDMIIANPSGANGANFQWRATAGAGASNTNSPSTQNIKTPQWVKLTRKGNVFSAQYSADGVTWLDIKNPALTGTPVTTTVNMVGDVYIGLCVTSHDAAQTAVAEFSGAATTGNVTGAWQQAWIGDDPDRTMDLASLYVIVEDSAGKSATATNATIANATAWTQWSIPFSDLTGVNMAKVKKLTLGVGDRKNPVKDGTGRIYIDDLGFGRPVR